MYTCELCHREEHTPELEQPLTLHGKKVCLGCHYADYLRWKRDEGECLELVWLPKEFEISSTIDLLMAQIRRLRDENTRLRVELTCCTEYLNRIAQHLENFAEVIKEGSV